MRYLFALLFVLSTALTAARAEIVEEAINYQHDGATCEGVIVYDNVGAERLPAVVIFHQWGGAGDYEKARARMLAEQGYAAFVADVYSTEIRPDTFEKRREATQVFRGNRPLARARAQAALSTMQNHPRVDAARTAAIGYCFGGFIALELARSGAPIQAVASIHGSLNNPTPADAANIRAKVLVQHGAIDPYVPAEELAAFKKEMDAAGASYEVIEYQDAVHAFTDWNAGDNPASGAAYNAAADTQSWTDLLDFLARTTK